MCISIPGRGKRFLSFPKRPYLSGASSLCCSLSPMGYFLDSKAAGAWSAKVKNWWTSTSCPHIPSWCIAELSTGTLPLPLPLHFTQVTSLLQYLLWLCQNTVAKLPILINYHGAASRTGQYSFCIANIQSTRQNVSCLMESESCRIPQEPSFLFFFNLMCSIPTH